MPRTLILLLALIFPLSLRGCAQPQAAQPHGALPSDTFASSLIVHSLACDSQPSPYPSSAPSALVISSPTPQLSWRLSSEERAQSQAAYRILVASTPNLLAQDRADLFDSGKVTSSNTLNIPYAGTPLAAAQTCHWKVMAFDHRGRASAWSDPAQFEVALQSPADWSAQWINDGKQTPSGDSPPFTPDPAPLFRKQFTLGKLVRRARLHIAGLGYYEASLNGARIGDHFLDPGWTNYSQRVLYSTFDVTASLRTGPNALGVTLGNGWYNPLSIRMFGRFNLREHFPIGRPRFIAKLAIDFADGTSDAIVSDLSWQVTDGPMVFNNIYLGEIYDARKEVGGWNQPTSSDPSSPSRPAWRTPALATEPIGPLQPQTQPPIRIIERINTTRVTQPKPGTFIHDLGQNFAGTLTLRLEAPLPPPGTTIVLRYGELLNQDGTLNPLTSTAGQIKGTVTNDAGVTQSIGGPSSPPIAWQTDTYITRGTPDSGSTAETYTPRFTFHGFRYVEVTGLPARDAPQPIGPITITGLPLSTNVQATGSFSCSNPLLNRIQEVTRRTFLSNIFSVQSDCPHRERFGYGGDIAATSDAFILNFDMSTFYAKVVRDFTDAQRSDGLFTDTAPFVGIQYCGVGWAMAQPLLLRDLHRSYANQRLISEHYAPAKRWLLKVAEQYPTGIITDGLSDHEGLDASPAPLMVTPLFIQSADLLASLARTQGLTEDAAQFVAIAATSRSAYQQAFPLGSTPHTQASLAFALHLSTLREEDRPAALDALLTNIRDIHNNHLSTGILGTKFMLDELSRSGHADLAYTIVTQPDFPGYAHMLNNGATTLWEHWAKDDNTYSHNHPMFGSVSEWMFKWLAGIQPAPDAVGFDSIIIAPQLVEGLDFVRCTYGSARGNISNNWQRYGASIRFELDIPVGVTAIVHLPASSPDQINERGTPLASGKIEGVEFLRVQQATPTRRELLLRVQSGRYTFNVTR